jgi:uncharacterized linocin/CFP29 family protein
VNHLLREKAPVTDAAWAEIEEEASRTLKHFLTARRLVDFNALDSWETDATARGRVAELSEAPEGVKAHIRAVQPLVEYKAKFALGPRCYTGVIETTEMGGYPVLEHLRLIVGGAVLWAPGVDGAVVLSTRGNDFELTVGQDASIGYSHHDEHKVHLYLEQSLTFQVLISEAAVHLVYT